MGTEPQLVEMGALLAWPCKRWQALNYPQLDAIGQGNLCMVLWKGTIASPFSAQSLSRQLHAGTRAALLIPSWSGKTPAQHQLLLLLPVLWKGHVTCFWRL
jgi:hypothetical protein